MYPGSVKTDTHPTTPDAGAVVGKNMGIVATVFCKLQSGRSGHIQPI